MTARPVAVDPVNSRWSNGSRENSTPTPPVSSKHCSFSGGKWPGSFSISRAAKCREFSLSFTMARLPAAKIVASGEKLRLRGKFHGTITPTTPRGCGITRLRAKP